MNTLFDVPTLVISVYARDVVRWEMLGLFLKRTDIPAKAMSEVAKRTTSGS